MTARQDHVWELTPQQLAQKLASNPKLRLIDVRELQEFNYCRLEGAELFPLNSLPQKLAAFDKEDELVFYCHHGVRSASALNYFYQQGYRNIAHLRGGIDAWSLTQDPTIPRY